MHWLPWAICLLFWLVLFVPNMRRKDRSLSRYPEWPAYERRTWMLLPRP